MFSQNINQITGPKQIDVNTMLGTHFSKVEMESLKIDLEQLQKTFTFKGLERIDDLIQKAKNSVEAKKLDEELKKKLQELIEKLKQAVERFGVRLELDNTKVGDPLVRVYNKINNRQLTTIPLQVLLKMLVSVRTPSGTTQGTPGQEFSPELIDNTAQDMVANVVDAAKANIVV